MLRVGERVRAIDARRHPRDQERDEEEEGDASVEEGIHVILTQRDGAGNGWDTEDCWAGGSPCLLVLGSLSLWGLADLDVDGIGVVAIVEMAFVDFDGFEAGEGGLALGGCDGHFGCG